MGGVLMKTTTKISYVVLKYDDQTDNVYTKTLNNANHAYELPKSTFVQKEDSTLADIRKYVISKMIDFNVKIDEKHLFFPFINVYTENHERVFNYVALIFESNKNTFSSMNYESWHRVKYDHDTKSWNLVWGSGLSDPVDFKFKDTALNEYAANPKHSDEMEFSNIMQFVTRETEDFPILGLLSGNQFTMKQVLHYQDLLGMDALKPGNDATFENRYSNSIQQVKDNRVTTSYEIKNDYLKK